MYFVNVDHCGCPITTICKAQIKRFNDSKCQCGTQVLLICNQNQNLNICMWQTAASTTNKPTYLPTIQQIFQVTLQNIQQITQQIFQHYYQRYYLQTYQEIHQQKTKKYIYYI